MLFLFFICQSKGYSTFSHLQTPLFEKSGLELQPSQVVRPDPIGRSPKSKRTPKRGMTSLPKREIAPDGGVLEDPLQPPAGSIPLQVERLVAGGCAVLPVREGSVPNARKTRQSEP